MSREQYWFSYENGIGICNRRKKDHRDVQIKYKPT